MHIMYDICTYDYIYNMYIYIIVYDISSIVYKGTYICYTLVAMILDL